MTIHVVAHAPGGGPGRIADLVGGLHIVRADEGELPIDVRQGDAVILMGGTEPVETRPWAIDERGLITDCVALGVPLLGICLGGEAISLALGGRTVRDRVYGWDSVRDPSGRVFSVFQWHDWSFTMPPGATAVWRDRRGRVVGWVRDRAMAVQFHPEMKAGMLADWTGGDPAVMGVVDERLPSSHALCASIVSDLLSVLGDHAHAGRLVPPKTVRAIGMAFEEYQIGLARTLAKAGIDAYLAGDRRGAVRLGSDYEELNYSRAVAFAQRYRDDMENRGGTTIQGEFTPWLRDGTTAARGAVVDAIEAGIREGRGSREIARDLRGVIDTEAHDPELTAKTEMSRLVHIGEKERYADEGVELMEYLLGDRACGDCAALAEADVGYGPGIYPIDDFPEIPVHPKCECDGKPVVRAAQESVFQPGHPAFNPDMSRDERGKFSSGGSALAGGIARAIGEDSRRLYHGFGSQTTAATEFFVEPQSGKIYSRKDLESVPPEERPRLVSVHSHSGEVGDDPDSAAAFSEGDIYGLKQSVERGYYEKMAVITRSGAMATMEVVDKPKFLAATKKEIYALAEKGHGEGGYDNAKILAATKEWAPTRGLEYKTGLRWKSEKTHVFEAGHEAYNPDMSRDESGKWSSGGGPSVGVTRSGKAWVTADGAPAPAHIQSLGIPPAWTDVVVNPDPEGDLLVKGHDKKGRTQYIYSERYDSEQQAAKFARISELDEKMDGVRGQIRADRQDPELRERADLMALVVETGIRPGSEKDTRGEVRAYGATTLEGRHVVETETGVRLQFVGKKGVAADVPVGDKSVADMLVERAGAVGPDGQLFPTVGPSELSEYAHGLDGGGFKTKDFRTYLGTSTAKSIIARTEAPTSKTAYKRSVRAVAKEVAARLGNTPTVALQRYIAPEVFTGWRDTAHA